MSLDQLPGSIFDLIVLAVIIVGVMRGRKHGMSEELFDLIKWITVVAACAFLYEPVGSWFATASTISPLAAYMIVYAAAAVLIVALFALLKRGLGGKLVGSDVFGRSEYYLGMGSGLVRFLCILMAVLALLNARYYPPEEVRAMESFQNDVYGSTYFPTWHSVQAVVFEKSLAGPYIRDYLGFLLIKPTRPSGEQFHQKDANLP
jgi:uncharacterized membrane protein required for colicin V production